MRCDYRQHLITTSLGRKCFSRGVVRWRSFHTLRADLKFESSGESKIASTGDCHYTPTLSVVSKSSLFTWNESEDVSLAIAKEYMTALRGLGLNSPLNLPIFHCCWICFPANQNFLDGSYCTDRGRKILSSHIGEAILHSLHRTVDFPSRRRCRETMTPRLMCLLGSFMQNPEGLKRRIIFSGQLVSEWMASAQRSLSVKINGFFYCERWTCSETMINIR